MFKPTLHVVVAVLALLSACARVGVTSAPTASLIASPTSIVAGGSAILTWTSTGATACTATGGWTGELAANGTASTQALAATT